MSRSPLDKSDERYRNDPTYRAVVDLLQGFIMKLELSPSEVREAAMYACYRQEMTDPKPLRIEFSPNWDRARATWPEPIQRSVRCKGPGGSHRFDTAEHNGYRHCCDCDKLVAV